MRGTAAFTRTLVAVGMVVAVSAGTFTAQAGSRGPRSSSPRFDRVGGATSARLVRFEASWPDEPASTTYYVSRKGNNGDGRSWATAWNELNQIKWSKLSPGDTVFIDGGAVRCRSPYDFTTTRPGVDCGMEYDTTLTVSASGTESAPIIVELSTESGRNGTAVVFGGRATPLPYCHQRNYSGKAVRQNGILVGANHDIIFDGRHRGGIMVYGAVQGVRVSSGSASRLTFERMEIFDNGSIETSPGGGSRTDDEGVSLAGGTDTRFIGDIIHDNGQDEIQDETRTGNSLNGLVIRSSWLFARRGHPDHPGEPFNDLQAVGDDTCTHADAIQLWSGGSKQSGLTVKTSVLGPLVNQGLYPGDGGTGATWNDVTVRNSLFLAISHNIISDSPVHGWRLDHDTLFAEQGGFEVPSNGDNTMTNVIKMDGYVYTPTWSGTTDGNVWWGGDRLPGSATHMNPGFADAPQGSLNPYSAFADADFTPSCGPCEGSSIHSIADILARIDAIPWR